ncbi:hypothetical protein PR048_006730 [Dryococelus australis]|uniref:Uncharacterized protein n=1 Tax=Dryococelus australis TaxID=614101 RepID=A0ABQ9IBR4_9NEOP|nr:hypothetical protein PR048_006730 [Dryococelus australis]
MTTESPRPLGVTVVTSSLSHRVLVLALPPSFDPHTSCGGRPNAIKSAIVLGERKNIGWGEQRGAEKVNKEGDDEDAGGKSED